MRTPSVWRGNDKRNCTRPSPRRTDGSRSGRQRSRFFRCHRPVEKLLLGCHNATQPLANRLTASVVRRPHRRYQNGVARGHIRLYGNYPKLGGKITRGQCETHTAGTLRGGRIWFGIPRAPRPASRAHFSAKNGVCDFYCQEKVGPYILYSVIIYCYTL